MLGVTLEHGQFLKIGNALVRITSVRGRAQKVRVAIEAPRSVIIDRFDQEGRSVTKTRQIVGYGESQGPQELALLSCGHSALVDLKYPSGTTYRCPVCGSTPDPQIVAFAKKADLDLNVRDH
jgi:sRNA-binding carbon storage regulator CsrA